MLIMLALRSLNPSIHWVELLRLFVASTAGNRTLNLKGNRADADDARAAVR